MTVNKYKPHILVLPEDDANRQIANGFVNNHNINELAIQILPNAGGWEKTVDQFTNNYVHRMRKFPDRMMVVLIDLDKGKSRLTDVQEDIPDDLKERVFVIGTRYKPEILKSFTRMSFEKIGETLAQDCANNTNNLWRHEELKHNETELERMRSQVKSFLFI